MLERIIDSISESFIGKRDTIEKVVAVLLAGGHLLIEDVPGVGKTTLAKSLAGCLSCGFTRIQFTPIRFRVTLWECRYIIWEPENLKLCREQ